MFYKLLVIFSFMLFFPMGVLGCMCGYTSVCQAYSEADVIVAARIVGFSAAQVPADILYLDAKRTERIEGQKVLLSVDRWYKGHGGKRLALVQPIGGCDWEFRERDKNQGFLFYLHKSRKRGSLSVMGCSRTARYGNASEDLSWLDGLPSSLKRTRISGRVFKFKGDSESSVPDIQVVIADPGRTFTAVTDSHGVFSFWDIPPGKYEVNLALQSPFVLRWTSSEEGSPVDDPLPRSIELKRGKCQGIDFAIRKRDDDSN
jgi:hypothetical protein